MEKLKPLEADAIRTRLGLNVYQLGVLFGVSGDREDVVKVARRWIRREGEIPFAVSIALRYMDQYGLPETALPDPVEISPIP